MYSRKRRRRGPVALTLAESGYSVVVLEKGPWFKEEDFYKDELASRRRDVYTPNLQDEQHVIEEPDGLGGWDCEPTSVSGWISGGAVVLAVPQIL